MLMITSFANPRVAQAFVDYMATQGVILTIQQHNQSDVWLADESQAERVRVNMELFQGRWERKALSSVGWEMKNRSVRAATVPGG